jgi:predicted Ser/Thr protein kinase
MLRDSIAHKAPRAEQESGDTLREGAPRRRKRASTLSAGSELVGRYRILGVLGEGGWGTVYHARDLTLELDVALKILHPNIARDPAKLAVFRNEVRVARMVTHPNVCRLHDLIDAPGGCFITMEYVAGESLAALLERGRLALPHALRILRDVARGLSASHAAGVIHRDLKPSNVLVIGDRVVVADFGIAGEDRTLGSGPQKVVGTLGYMAPEQTAGGPLDARVDVYAFGVLACVLATGQHPPQTPARRARHRADLAASLAAELTPLLADLPATLAQLIADCLALDPRARPRDACAVLRRLDALVPTDELDAAHAAGGRGAHGLGAHGLGVGTPTHGVAADSPRLASQGHAPGRRSRRSVLVLDAVLVVALAAGTGSLGPAPRAEPPVATATAPTSPRILLPAVDVTAMPDDDRWLGPVVQRLIADELIDAWELDVELGASSRPAPDTVTLPTRLARDPSGRLRLAFDGELREATTARELAIAVAARIVTAHIPAGLQHPVAAELAAVGAHDVEAWRLWRRAEHETLLLRWEQARDLCRQALARDPAFPVARVELALTYTTQDAAGIEELTRAEELMKRVPVGPVWQLAVIGAHQLRAGNGVGAAITAAKVLALDLTPRERFWVDLRWTIARYVRGAPAEIIAPTLVRLAEAHPDQPAAFKLLADQYLSSDSPTAPTLALRYATRANELAPEDASARADLAIALLLAGRPGEARAHAAVLGRLDADDKRRTQSRLFVLHMALDDLAEAELDAQRELSGSPEEHAEGVANAARIDLYWGRFDRGVRGLLASADEYEALGTTVAAAARRYLAGRQAWLLGDRRTALAAFERAAAGPARNAANARVRALIAAGKLDEARRIAAALPEATAERASAELAIADAAHDPAATLAAFAGIEQLSTELEHLLPAADALERTGRVEEATAMFERLASPVYAGTEPVAAIHAWIRLGHLRERAGDLAGARAAFTEVVRRWGNATARTPEVDDARRWLRVVRGK